MKTYSRQHFITRFVLPGSLLFLLTPNIYATNDNSPEIENPSGAPTAGRLVGGLTVNPGSPEASAGIAIENLCPQLVSRGTQNTSAQADLRDRCGDLIFATTNQSSNLREVVAEEMATQETEVVELSNNQLGRVAARLAGLRSGILASAQQLSLHSSDNGTMAFNISGSPTGGAAGDGLGDSGRWGFFINGEISSGDKDETANESGFDIDATSITAGLDYRLSPTSFIGGALGINQSDADMKNNGGNIESDGVSITGYGTRIISDNLFIDGSLGLGKYDYDTTRNVNYIGRRAGRPAVPVNQRATASTDADVIFASLGIGRDSEFKRDEGVRLTFSGRLNYLNADVDGFTETMSNQDAAGFGMNLEIDKQDIKSLTSVLGVHLDKAISTKSGVIIPFGAISYIHEFEDDPRVILARFANDPFSTGFDQRNGTFPNNAPAQSNGQPIPTIISITTDSPDTDYFQLAGGVSGVLPNGKNWFASFSTTLGLDDTSYYSLTVGYRGEF